VIIFGLVLFLSKKSNQTKKILKKPKSVPTETGSNQPVSVQLGFFGQKPVQTGLARVFSGFFCLGSIRFSFFGFSLIKPKSNRTERSVCSKF
jgi:hypothetical protein